VVWSPRPSFPCGHWARGVGVAHGRAPLVRRRARQGSRCEAARKVACRSEFAVSVRKELPTLLLEVGSQNVSDHGGTTGAQTSLKWEGKPTVPTAR